MSRAYSAAARRELHSTQSMDPPVVLLEIAHSGLVAPVRVVNDTQSLTSTGNLFQAIAFRAVLPDDSDGKLPQASLEIDNVGRELMSWLEVSNGGSGATARLMQVRRSAPDTIEFEITMDVTSVRANAKVVSATLGFDNLLDRPAVRIRYDQSTAPGLY